MTLYRQTTTFKEIERNMLERPAAGAAGGMGFTEGDLDEMSKELVDQTRNDGVAPLESVEQRAASSQPSLLDRFIGFIAHQN